MVFLQSLRAGIRQRLVEGIPYNPQICAKTQGLQLNFCRRFFILLDACYICHLFFTFLCQGIAFLLANAQELFDAPGEMVYDKIQQFISVHRNSFLVIVAALHGPEEWDLMFSIQLR